MRRQLVVAFILVIGALIGAMMTKLFGSVYYGVAVFVLAIGWAYMWHIEEIKVSSCHYRLAEKYFADEVKKLCKACPYWGLVALATFAFIIEHTAKIVYGTVLQMLFYPYAAIAWLFGFRPVYKRLTYTGAHNRRKHLFFHTEKGNGPPARSEVWPILAIGPVVAIVAFLHLGTETAYGFYGSMAWYYDALVSYGAMLSMVLVGDIWRSTAWRGVTLAWRGVTLAAKWFYRKSCPSIKFVQPAPELAKPRMPTHRLPPEGANG